MKLVTVATSSEGYFPWLKMSSERNGFTLDVLGWGETWKGYTWKFHLMEKYLMEQAPDELVCFMDGYDVIVLRSHDEMVNKYKEMVQKYGKRIIIADEIYKRWVCYITAWMLFGKHKDQKHILNSGVYMGPAKDLLEVIRYIHANIANDPKADDQISMNKYYMMFPSNIHVDTNTELIMNIDTAPQINDPNIIIDKIGNMSYNGQNPAILHLPGNSKMDDIIEALGYPITAEDKAMVCAHHKKAIIRKTIYHTKRQLPLLLILVLVIIILWWVLRR